MNEENLNELLAKAIGPDDRTDLWPIVTRKIKAQRHGYWEYPIAVVAGLLAILLLHSSKEPVVREPMSVPVIAATDAP